ncbi:helix-turn-helix domain-containing protein [Pseudacidovorax intermedius]|uniref:helix-turn-helix domain-containing protein n=1 Tax=Pseudacidovorax intermedius TaxID=433924 RepID=UPI0012DF87FB|nr:helix-turn-helix transcriptional regulator [Pseudacidovorax intermedius]
MVQDTVMPNPATAPKPNAYPEMEAKESHARRVLASNVQGLMAQNGSLNSNVKLSNASGVSIATLSRVMSMHTAATLDTITRLAAAFGLEPHQLLMPNLDAAGPHATQEISAEDRVLLAKFKALAGELRDR